MSNRRIKEINKMMDRVSRCSASVKNLLRKEAIFSNKERSALIIFDGMFTILRERYLSISNRFNSENIRKGERVTSLNNMRLIREIYYHNRFGEKILRDELIRGGYIKFSGENKRSLDYQAMAYLKGFEEKFKSHLNKV